MDCSDRFCWLFFLSLICVFFCHFFGLVSAIKSHSGLLFLFSTYSIEVTCGLSFYLFFLNLRSTGNTLSCWDMMRNVLVNKCAWSTHQDLAITVLKGATLLCTLQLMGWSDVHYNKLMIPIKLAWTSLGRFIMLRCSACLLKCKRNGECQRLLIYPWYVLEGCVLGSLYPQCVASRRNIMTLLLHAVREKVFSYSTPWRAWASSCCLCSL